MDSQTEQADYTCARSGDNNDGKGKSCGGNFFNWRAL